MKSHWPPKEIPQTGRFRESESEEIMDCVWYIYGRKELAWEPGRNSLSTSLRCSIAIRHWSHFECLSQSPVKAAYIFYHMSKYWARKSRYENPGILTIASTELHFCGCNSGLHSLNQHPQISTPRSVSWLQAMTLLRTVFQLVLFQPHSNVFAITQS